jgi:cell division protein FtsL
VTPTLAAASDPREPRWDVPYPYGWEAAIESAGAVAAPLLAGFSITLITLVLSIESLHWANVALFLLVAATLCLLGAVQATFWMRRFVVTPSELSDWWGDELKNPDRLLAVEQEQRTLAQQQRVWAGRARWLYDGGILFLLLALPAMLVPKGGINHAGAMRLAAIALALLGFAAELLWTFSVVRRRR